MAENGPRHNPFEGVTDYFSELTRMREVGTHGRENVREDRERTHASAWVPATDILARGDDLVIRVDLAGVNPDTVDLSLVQGNLTISGVRPSTEDDAQFYVRERFYGAFRRTVTLPDGVRREQISARLDDGLVEVTVRGGARSEGERIAIDDTEREPRVRTID